ncbi:MAG TPA: hypothetical protein VMT50_06075 [Steroidobacteraceae bacterium]|nr:hypothetical protein [Steroidobacteraceae bacterium]
MLDDHNEGCPGAEELARTLAACGPDGRCERLVEAWLDGWSDHEGAWTNLRNFRHWIERVDG